MNRARRCGLCGDGGVAAKCARKMASLLDGNVVLDDEDENSYIDGSGICTTPA